MAYILSPAVVVQEYDNTGIVPGVSTTEAGLAGQFNWGPVNELKLVSNEADLVKIFWKPDSTNASDWFSASNFVAYSDKLWIVRVVNEDNANTALRATNATAANSNGFLVKNDTHYYASYNNGSLKTTYGTGDWIARYAGAMGNSLKVSVCASSNAFSSTLTGTVTASANSTTITGSGTLFTTQVTVGDLLVLGNDILKVASVANTTSLTVTSRTSGASSAATAVRRWEFYNQVGTAPGTSDYTTVASGSADEMHIAVVDEDGKWTGVNNTVLEVYPYVSKASDAKNADGSSNYYVNQINSKSSYIKWAGHSSLISGIGNTAASRNFGSYAKPINASLVGGKDGTTVGNSEKIRGYSYFVSPEDVEVSLIIGSGATQTVATYIISNICEVRKDCVAFFSPPQAYVVNNAGSETTSCVTYRNTLPSTSYAALDSSWKFQYDRYNDVNRWLPYNGDIAGLHSQTDQLRDAWFPAAGLNRGQIKNNLKPSWNPKLADRDILYKNGINPIVTFPGEGTVLFGQKTLLSKPSAFDRINVRRLFIVLEKAISRASKYFLFELNDPITRAQFKNMVEPYLRDVQGRRGIYAFKVICDETNNTDEVIERNEFVGDIYVRPARSAEGIRLNFVAIRGTGEVTFTIG